MPDAPTVNPFVHYVLENFWPLFVILLAVGGVMLWSGAREGLIKRMKIGGVVIALAIVVAVIGTLVVTSGEHAKRITRALVDAAVAKDTLGAVNLFADDAAFTVVSPQNPGFGIEFIQSQLAKLAQRYTIQSNTITMLRGFSESSTQATVHMACYTIVDGYPNISRWVLKVRREPASTNGQSGSDWRIIQITCVAINDRTPPIGEVW